MPQGKYRPEGTMAQSRYTADFAGMEQAIKDGAIIEGRAVMCDEEHNLIVDINGMPGVIMRRDALAAQDDGGAREIAIISRVGKPVCFKVLGYEDGHFILSRRLAQEEALDYFMQELFLGEVIQAKVTHMEPFGVFVDIGCGIVSFIGIENISVSRISHPRERFSLRQDIYAAVLHKDYDKKRVTLTHKELLGTWEENAGTLSHGQTVTGIVRGVEDYGVFVELAPNLSGLAERRDGMALESQVSVYIKSVIPERMKIKLIIIDSFERPGITPIREDDYFIKEGRLERWRYTPECCENKVIERVF